MHIILDHGVSLNAGYIIDDFAACGSRRMEFLFKVTRQFYFLKWQQKEFAILTLRTPDLTSTKRRQPSDQRIMISGIFGSINNLKTGLQLFKNLHATPLLCNDIYLGFYSINFHEKSSVSLEWQLDLFLLSSTRHLYAFFSFVQRIILARYH